VRQAAWADASRAAAAIPQDDHQGARGECLVLDLRRPRLAPVQPRRGDGRRSVQFIRVLAGQRALSRPRRTQARLADQQEFRMASPDHRSKGREAGGRPPGPTKPARVSFKFPGDEIKLVRRAQWITRHSRILCAGGLFCVGMSIALAVAGALTFLQILSGIHQLSWSDESWLFYAADFLRIWARWTGSLITGLVGLVVLDKRRDARLIVRLWDTECSEREGRPRPDE
jgi:hypothetical protein